MSDLLIDPDLELLAHVKRLEFWGKTKLVGDCLEWQGTTSSEGYGKHGSEYAHRVAFELAWGPIPEGTEPDHLCRNRPCVRPDHLEAVTRRENFLRGDHPTAITIRSGVCGRGHSMTDAYVRKNGKRTCRACSQENARRRRREKDNAAA